MGKFLLFAICSIFSVFQLFSAESQNGEVKKRPASEMHYKILPLGSVDYETVNQICRPMLSAGGIMTYEEKRASVLVYDNSDVIAKIDKFLRDLDREVVNIRISVDFINNSSEASDRIDVDIDPVCEKRPVNTKNKDGKTYRNPDIKIDASRKRGTATNNVSQFIMTKSGFPASLWAGTTIIDPGWLESVRRYLGPVVIVNGDGTVLRMDSLPPDFKWSNVGASMKVLPFYRTDGLIDVEFYPEVSFIDGKGRKQFVKVEQLSSKLTVSDGQRIYAGGVISANEKTCANIFGPDFFAGKGKKSILDMYITATAVKPDGRGVKENQGSAGRDYSDPRNIFKR